MTEKRIAIVIDANGQAAIGELDTTTGAFTRLGDAGEKAGKKVRESADAADKASKKWGDLGKNVGAVLGSMAVGLGLMVTRQINVADQTGKTAAKLGVTSKFISEMGFVAKESGANAKILETGLFGIGDAAAKAEAGAKGPIAAFRSIGIEVLDAHGKLKSLETLLPQIADRFARMKDGPREAAIATKLFGSAGKDLLPLLNLGSAGIDQLRKKAQELGLSLDDEATSSAAKFKKNLGELADQTTGLVNVWMVDALPALVEFSGELVASGGDATEAGKQYSALGLIVKSIGTGYYLLEAAVKIATYKMASTLDGLVQGFQAAGTHLTLFFKGAMTALGLYATGDVAGAFKALWTTSAQMRENVTSAADAIGKSWAQAEEMTSDAAGEAARKIDEIWNPTMDRAKGASEGATGAADGLGEGFLGAGAKAENAAARAEKAMQRLRDLVRDQQNATLSDVEVANNDYAEVQERIKLLEKETRVLAGLAEREQLLAAFRKAAADAHEKNLRVAQASDEQRARELNIVGTLLDEYRKELNLVGLTTRQHAIEEAVIEAKTRARALYNKGLRESADLAADEEENIRRSVGAMEDQREMLDRSAAAAEEYRNSWWNAIDAVSSAFGDWMTGGIKSFKDFGRTLGDIAKRFIADIITQIARAQIGKAIGNWASALSGGGGGGTNWLSTIARMFGGGGGGGGAGGGGGNWLSTISSMFGGGGGGGGSGGGMWSSAISAFSNGFSSAGAAGGGFWSSLMNGFTSAVSSFTGALSAGSTSVAQFGAVMSNWGLATTGAAGAGASGAGAAAGGAGLGAAASVSWIPIVGWIVAGIMASSAAYKAGWRIDGQKSDMTEYYASKGMIGGAVATATVGAADQLLRSLGFKDSWAAALSGSSLHTKLWGHKKPQVQAQGIQGSIGFGGFDGQATADIKAKGGWFRSDKKWTETGALSPVIDRAFDNMAESVAARTADLAKQLGTDVSAQLGKVKINLGKMNFDKDPEKAREQIAEKIAELMEGLSVEAIKALGFTRLLDDGFQAGEIMGALSASIALVTGGADKLGRALSALEKENVARAVEYFEGLAIKNGTSLGDEVQRVVGTLGEYASIVSGADAQIRTAGLNSWQQAQLEIETTYRNQVKQLNALAKSLGLSGARAEDLAKIEQLRALNMANLQKQMEQQRDTFLQDLGLSELSPLTDRQKLDESMQMFNDAVGQGDLGRAQSLSQTVLGLGRSLFASGNDYNALYGQVTGALGGIQLPSIEDTSMGDLADILLAIPEQIAQALFNTLYTPATPPPTAPPVTAPGTNTGPAAGGGGGNGNIAPILQLIAQQMAVVARNTGTSARTSEFAALNAL